MFTKKLEHGALWDVFMDLNSIDEGVDAVIGPWRYVLYICLHTATRLFSTRLSDIAEQATEKIDSIKGVHEMKKNTRGRIFF